MARHVVLLRAVNLGSRNKVAMPKLRDALSAAGYDDVITYVASGNVVLSSSQSAAAVATGVRDVIAAEFGLDIAVLVRSAAQLRAVVKGNPWPEAAAEPTKLVVAFLDAKPPKGALADVDAAAYEPERFALSGSELYLWYRNGQARTKLSAGFFEKALKVPATARNWNTVTKLVELADG